MVLFLTAVGVYMDYLKHYHNLCSSRKELCRSREDNTYYENHHIIPKSLGGGEGGENKVLLTAREHYIAHLLLYKHYKEVGGVALQKMSLALVSMGTVNRNLQRATGSRSYSYLREAAINAVLGRKVVDTTKYKQSKTAQHCEAIRAARLQAPPRSLETRKKQSLLKKGKVAIINKTIVTCPVCEKQGQELAMKRWHFQNCKVGGQNA